MPMQPENAPIWKDKLDDAYGRRTLAALFWFLLTALVVIALIWFLWPLRPAQTPPGALPQISPQAGNGALAYGVIQGGTIRPLDTWVAQGYMSAEELAAIAPAAGQPAQPIRGGVYDYDGNLVGKIDALVYEGNRIRRLNFVLAPELTPWTGMGQSISLPIEDAIISWDETGYTVHLTRLQTYALSENLFGPPEP